MITKKKYKAMYEKVVKELKQEVETHEKILQTYSNLTNDYSNTIEDLKKTIEKNVKEIENLNKELDIYKEYYHVDREPTEEEQLKILTNLRIHDLEKENSDLKSELCQTKLSLNAEQAHKSCYVPSFYVPPYRPLLF